MSETMHAVHPGEVGGTTDDDHRTALRFVLGRPGWRVEVRATARDGAHLRLTTPCPGTGGRRYWSVVRTQPGFLVYDEASGQRLWTVPTVREALVEIWEAATGAAPD